MLALLLGIFLVALASRQEVKAPRYKEPKTDILIANIKYLNELWILHDRDLEFSVEVPEEMYAHLEMSKCGIVTKRGWTPHQSYWIRRALEIANCNKSFVALLNSENGNWNHRTIGVNPNGTRDHGFCQINDYWHPEVVYHAKFYDQEWQLKECYRLWTGGTRFYAKPHLKNLTFSS